MIARLTGTHQGRVFLLLFAAALGAYFAGLFVDVTRDGSKYATLAREIYERGDWVNLSIHGEPYLQKPPLLFWLSAISFHIFGLSNFAFKLPLLLLSFAGLYFLYRLGKSIYSRKTGLMAALLLGSSQVFFLYNMDIHTDTVMQPLVTFALWQLYDFIRTGKNLHYILGFCGVGLAMLTKGPVGAVVPAFAVAGHLIFTGRYKKIADIRWFLGIIIALAVILPALAGLYNQFGWEGLKFYFWGNNAGRISGLYTGSHRDPLYYAYNLLFLFSPWMLLLFVSVFFEFRSIIQRKFKCREWYVFSGIWFFFLVLSFSKGKLPNYIFVLMPLFSLLAAKYAVLAVAGCRPLLFRLFMRLQSSVAVLLLITLSFLFFWLFPPCRIWQWVVFVAGIVLAGFSFFGLQTREAKLLIPSLALTITLNFFINQHVAPQIFGDQASIKAAKIFNEQAGSGDLLYNYNYDSHEMFFYSKTPVNKLINDITLFELMKKPGNWVLTTGEVVNRMPEGEFPKPEIIPLKHVWMNKLNFRYLNPKTRDISYDTLFLLRSGAGGS